MVHVKLLTEKIVLRHDNFRFGACYSALTMPSEMSQRIASARHSAGYHRVEDFASALGVSGTAVRKWERGDSQPAHENLERIAELTNKPIGYFYGEESASVADALAQVQRLLANGEIARMHPDGTIHATPLIELPVLTVTTAGNEAVQGAVAMPQLLLPDDVPVAHLAVAYADARAPEGLAEGDMLLVDTRSTEPADGTLVVVEEAGELIARRAYVMGGQLLLVGAEGTTGRVNAGEILGTVARIIAMRDPRMR